MMNKNEYAIWIEDGKAVIVDIDGREISMNEAWTVIHLLEQTYPEKCFVYLGQSRKDHRWKIGMSRNVARRAAELAISIVHQIECDNASKARDLEAFLFNVCSRSWDEGEWFYLNDEQIGFIRAFGTDAEIDTAIERIDNITCYALEHVHETSSDEMMKMVNDSFGGELSGFNRCWVIIFLGYMARLIRAGGE